MPSYEYSCPSCGTILTRIVPISDRDDQDCFFCDRPLTRNASAPGFVLRGPGFHSNDYPKKDR